MAKADRDILKQEEENTKLEELISNQNKHIDSLNEEKLVLHTKYIKAKEEPSKINNNINKSQKAVEKLAEKIGEIE